MKEPNILLGEWEYPPFHLIHTDDYPPAIRAAIEEAEQAIECIATNPEAPTFENTIEALECADRKLQRISSIMMNLNECCTSDELQNVVMQLEPEITRFSMKVVTDRRLYERIEKLKIGIENSANAKLSVEQQTLLDNTIKSFVRHGIALPDTEREQYKRNEEDLSELKLRFSQNALADLNDWFLHITDESELSGLPDTVCTAANEEGASRGLKGWVFTLAAPSYIPFMAFSDRRDLREKMYCAYGSIGGRGNEHDNNEIIRRIVALRSEQAKLLGYNTYCDYVLEDRMVKSLPNLRRFMDDLRSAVLPAAKKDLADMSEISGIPQISGWDISYLSEKLKQQRYSFDSEALLPYFPLDAVKEGIFALYGRLYGLRFEEDNTIPVYHKDVTVYRVKYGEREMGILYLDMYPRPSKRSGAWMTEFRGQHDSIRPQIQVVCNFSKPTANTPSLLRFSEVETFMHEMGHAMHGMLSEVHYESLSGTNVKRDFVEMPSQVMENWCYEPEFLSTFARHWQTGEPLPTEYIDKIRAAQNHLAGWLCLRQLNLGYTDIAFHTSEWSDKSDSSNFKAEEIESSAMTNLLLRTPGCCTATNFSHIFCGGYASGYYGYKWAEVLDADIFSRFKEEGIFNQETAQRFRREILSRGGTQHPSILFKNFMGREPDNKALLKRMNLI